VAQTRNEKAMTKKRLEQLLSRHLARIIFKELYKQTRKLLDTRRQR
jgi:hypothetical protein